MSLETWLLGLRGIVASALCNGVCVLFVLLPGAGCEPWIWHLVVDRLQVRGHDAVGVRLPYGDGRAGLSEYADAVVGAVDGRQDVVVVAQSLAGFVAPLVCARLPVRLLVLLNAMIPLPGETAGEWWEHVDHASALAPVVAEYGPLESWDAAAQVAVFLNDVESALAAESANHVGPPGAGIFSSPLAIDAWPELLTRGLAGRRDRFFPLEFQRRVARERLQLELDEIDSGHSPMLSRPEELAARLVAYADEA